MLATAINFQRNGSLRLFHIALADTLYTNETVTGRVAMDLYNEVLRDPTPSDWTLDPLESLSVMMVPHYESYEHWFDVAVERKDHERLLEISDLARRHKFLSTLELGGRLHNLRWLLEGPEDQLDQESKVERQDIVNRYTKYNQLREQAQKLRAELKQAPLFTSEQREQHVQSDRLAKLPKSAPNKSLLLREIAIRREPSKILFPPCRRLKISRLRFRPDMRC